MKKVLLTLIIVSSYVFCSESKKKAEPTSEASHYNIIVQKLEEGVQTLKGLGGKGTLADIEALQKSIADLLDKAKLEIKKQSASCYTEKESLKELAQEAITLEKDLENIVLKAYESMSSDAEIAKIFTDVEKNIKKTDFEKKLTDFSSEYRKLEAQLENKASCLGKEFNRYLKYITKKGIHEPKFSKKAKEAGFIHSPTALRPEQFVCSTCGKKILAIPSWIQFDLAHKPTCPKFDKHATMTKENVMQFFYNYLEANSSNELAGIILKFFKDRGDLGGVLWGFAQLPEIRSR